MFDRRNTCHENVLEGLSRVSYKDRAMTCGDQPAIRAELAHKVRHDLLDELREDCEDLSRVRESEPEGGHPTNHEHS